MGAFYLKTCLTQRTQRKIDFQTVTGHHRLGTERLKPSILDYVGGLGVRILLYGDERSLADE